jgi:hypothetical protein
MSGLIVILGIVVALVVFDYLAVRIGVDSRAEFNDPRAPLRGISI